MPQTGTQYLLFTLGTRNFALDLARITEICDVPPLSPLPISPPCFAGAINFHGEIVAILDLTIPLQLTDNPAYHKLIVLRHEHASLGLLIDDTVSIVHEEHVLTEDHSSWCASRALQTGNAPPFPLLDPDLIASYTQTEVSKLEKN